MLDEARPIFLQIAERIEAEILDGTLAEETQVPSTTELSLFHRINPATAAKGVNQLVADGTLYKRRGIGMFVTTGAREKLRARRRDQFERQFVRPLLDQARALGIDTDQLVLMIRKGKGTP